VQAVGETGAVVMTGADNGSEAGNGTGGSPKTGTENCAGGDFGSLSNGAENGSGRDFFGQFLSAKSKLSR
jgi:hypothetical protein